MSDPRQSPAWADMSHEERMEALLGAILDELTSVNGNVLDVEEAVKTVRNAVQW